MGKEDKDQAAVQDPPEAEEAEWQDVFVDRFQFVKEGDALRGILVEKTKVNLSGKDVGSYAVAPEPDMLLSFLGSTTLDRQMAQIPMGDEVQITFTGTAPTARGLNPVKLYSVRHRSVKVAPSNQPF